MAESYSSSLKITLIGDGDLAGTWGDTTNTNWNLVEQAITGVDTLSAMGDSNYTLSNLNGTSDEARNQTIIIPSSTTLSATRYVYAPFVNKTYIISNQSSGGQSIYIQGIVSGTPTGSPLLIPNGVTTYVYCDGSTGFYAGLTGSAGNFKVNGTLSATGLTDTGNLTVGGNLGVTGATTLSGTATAITPAYGTNNTQIATTAFVNTAVSTATSSLGTMSTQNANNVTISGGTINGVSGTNSGMNVGYATTAGNGGVTSVNGNTGAVTVSTTPVGLGWGGTTWHDVTGSRSQGVTYTNNYSYPISVSISFSTSNDQSWRFYVNGIQLGGITEHQDFNYAWVGGIVPPGSTYLFTGNYLSVWAELY